MRTIVFVGVLAILFGGFFAAHEALARRASVAAMATNGGSTSLEVALGRVAQRVSGRDDVGVRCGDTGDPAVLGTVSFYGDEPGKEAILAPKICKTLASLLAGAPLPSLACTAPGRGECGRDVIALAWASSALAHESYHLAGIRDEAATECYGLQATALVAASLGAPLVYADQLGDYTFWNVRPPVDGGYFSPECRAGGKLDLDPTNPAWP